MSQDILFPVGRLVGGSLYRGFDKDAEGKQRIVKTGQNAGQPMTQFFFQVAIPKTAGHTHWAQTEWGAKVWGAGATAFPQSYQSPVFAWKVKDGDSQIPNRRGRKPCENEGWPGCWVLSFASSFAPKIYNADGSQAIVEPDAVKPGYFIQVFGAVDGNGSAQQPGVYLNHRMVAFAAYGAEINLGMDAAAVGFGGAGVALPAGASAVPLTQGFNPAAPVAAAPIPGAPVPPAVAPSMPGLPPMPGSVAPPGLPQVAVVPQQQFLQPAAPAQPVTAVAPPGLPPMPGPASVTPPPQAPRVHQMTTLAGGASYEQHIAAGWTDATLIQHGRMLP